MSAYPAKIQWLMRTWRGPFDRVEILERAHTPDEDILAHFNGAARPVVVRGYLAGTPLAGITFEDVRARAGALMLDPRWKPSHIYNTIDSSANDARISLDDYLAAAVLGETVRQDLYVRFRNLRVPLEFRNALGLLRPAFLRPHEVHLPCIWMGAAGSCSNLHTDPQDNFVLCVIGHKRFWLHPPSALPDIQAESVMGSAFLRSPLDPREAGHPVPTVALDLYPGDLLLLPMGWAHFVECLAPAFTYNYWLDPRETPFFERASTGTRQ